MTVTSVCHCYQFLKVRVKNYIIQLLYALVVVSKQKHKPLSGPRMNMKSQRTMTIRERDALEPFNANLQHGERSLAMTGAFQLGGTRGGGEGALPVWMMKF